SAALFALLRPTAGIPRSRECLRAGGSEEELPPGRPPVVGARDELSRVDDLDARLVLVLSEGGRGVELDTDLARPPRVIGLDRMEVGEGVSRRLLDQLPRAQRRDVARGEPAEALLDGDRRQARTEQLASLRAHRL